MDVTRSSGTDIDAAVSRIASAIGEPARSRMLFALMDNRARSSTELAVIANVSPSTASVHLNRLVETRLVKVLAQGKHRYYSLEGPEVADALEGLNVLAGASPRNFVPNTPTHLRAARTCYDHIAGALGVALHDRMRSQRWLSIARDNTYSLTPSGTEALESIGVDIESARTLRRRFLCPCLDWSERRPHLGGAIGAAILHHALKKRWLTQELDSRVLNITALGRRELVARFGVQI
jgi:DNA-binding transcriptional ArsR family regulator